MIASLPMYWRAENADLWRAYWAEVQRAAQSIGLSLPALTTPTEIKSLKAHWLRDDLALSMTCGLPLRTSLRDQVAYVGTLDFDLDAAPAHYYSEILRPAHADPNAPLDTLTLAYNAPDSQSGWAVTQASAPSSRRPRFANMICTGSHANSMAAVARGTADIAYVDAVTWRLLQRFDPLSTRLRVAGRSVTTPGLPLIAAKGTDVTALRRALKLATRSFQPDDPMAMGGPLGFHVLNETAYVAMPVPTPPA